MTRKKTKYTNPFLKVKTNKVSDEDSLVKSINEGVALHQQGLLKQAHEVYCAILKIDKQNPDALHLLGVIDYQTRNFQSAVQKISQAISINPSVALYYSNLGNALQELKQFEASLKCYEKAIELNSNCLEAYSNRGVALQELSKWGEAIESFDMAITLKPDYAEAYSNKGVSLQKLRKIPEALICYNKALELSPNYAEAYSNKGSALKELKDWSSAIICYEKALELKPNIPYLQGMLLHAKMKVCDWTSFDSEFLALQQQILNNSRASVSFPVLSMPTTLLEQRRVAEIWVSDKHPENKLLGPIERGVKNSKIRIGYYSADFHNHATSYLMAELFERHDKSKFELIGFSFGPNQQDEMRLRVSKAFDKFLDVTLMSDLEVAKLSRELGVDIAVDLKGLTHEARMGIFAYRAAPVQVSYLGYPGTSGASYIDYLVADKTVIPLESRPYYSEKIVYMPDSYQVNDQKKTLSKHIFSKAELGLPEDAFVFCCFNNNFKITPQVFASWVRILKSIEGSVLWLFEDNPTASLNLKNWAKASGLDPSRLIFASQMDLPRHLSRHKCADLFLDTLPYNAHTTASDALWSGLPVITCKGESFASRVAASLLFAINLPELVTSDLTEYENLAIELANNPLKLKLIKDKLNAAKLTAPLFNTELFCKNIEAAYVYMHDRFIANLAPDHISVHEIKSIYSRV